MADNEIILYDPNLPDLPPPVKQPPATVDLAMDKARAAIAQEAAARLRDYLIKGDSEAYRKIDYEKYPYTSKIIDIGKRMKNAVKPGNVKPGDKSPDSPEYWLGGAEPDPVRILPAEPKSNEPNRRKRRPRASYNSKGQELGRSIRAKKGR